MQEAKQIWGRKGQTLVRKYRCSGGKRHGRIVSSPTACHAAPNVARSARMKVTRARLGKVMARRAKRTKRINPASKRLAQGLNKRR
jgi:hypothetical protein